MKNPEEENPQIPAYKHLMFDLRLSHTAHTNPMKYAGLSKGESPIGKHIFLLLFFFYFLCTLKAELQHKSEKLAIGKSNWKIERNQSEFKQSVAKVRKANPFCWLTLTPLPPFPNPPITPPQHSHSLGARIIERKTLRRNKFGFSCRLAHNFLACLRSVVGLLAFGHFICCRSLLAAPSPPTSERVCVRFCPRRFVPRLVAFNGTCGCRLLIMILMTSSSGSADPDSDPDPAGMDFVLASGSLKGCCSFGCCYSCRCPRAAINF